MPEEKEQLFRREAIEHAASAGHDGRVLRLTPAWMTWSFWLLAAAMVFYAAFGLFGRIFEYAT